MITYKNILDFLAQPTVIIVIVIACTGLVLLWQGFLNAVGKDIFDFFKKFFCKEKANDKKNNDNKSSQKINFGKVETDDGINQSSKKPIEQSITIKKGKIKGGINQEQ